jgi:hypothetical protein
VQILRARREKKAQWLTDLQRQVEAQAAELSREELLAGEVKALRRQRVNQPAIRLARQKKEGSG